MRGGDQNPGTGPEDQPCIFWFPRMLTRAGMHARINTQTFPRPITYLCINTSPHRYLCLYMWIWEASLYSSIRVWETRAVFHRFCSFSRQLPLQSASQDPSRRRGTRGSFPYPLGWVGYKGNSQAELRIMLWERGHFASCGAWEERFPRPRRHRGLSPIALCQWEKRPSPGKEFARDPTF